MYFVQRKRNDKWISENVRLDIKPFESIEDARKFAGWVSRNGYLPSGALPPRR